jgi:hypothetical protein
MARARLLKPGFFKNEELAALEPHARLLYAGLWTLADREGRLEDRPVRIRAELFPYEALDVDTLLSALELAGFVVRYAVGAGRYIRIPTFLDHQTPHVREAASTLPNPIQGDVEHQARPRLDQDKASPRSPVPVPVPVPVPDPETVSVSVPDPVPETETGTRAPRERERALRGIAKETLIEHPNLSDQDLLIDHFAIYNRSRVRNPKRAEITKAFTDVLNDRRTNGPHRRANP